MNSNRTKNSLTFSTVIVFAFLFVLFFVQTVLSHSRSRHSPDWHFKAVGYDSKKLKGQKLNPVVVAVIDTGVDTNHPNLKKSLWLNSGESGIDSNGKSKESNGIDDDGNGFIDDVHGWNFVEQNSNLDDRHGHGTHVSGIIAAKKTKTSHYEGLAPNAKVMVLNYYKPGLPGIETIMNTVHAIDYAIKMGAQVINYSSGGRVPNQKEFAAIKRAEAKGIVFVSASGNESSNSDLVPYYPSDYKLKNMISVTAIGRTRHVLPSSNYGARTVDLAAPGESVFSTMPNGKFGFMTGTSQATAFVTGAVVLMLGKNKELEVDDLKQYLSGAGQFQTNLLEKTKSPVVVHPLRSLGLSSLVSEVTKVPNYFVEPVDQL